jgi:hypothetical protein
VSAIASSTPGARRTGSTASVRLDGPSTSTSVSASAVSTVGLADQASATRTVSVGSWASGSARYSSTWIACGSGPTTTWSSARSSLTGSRRKPSPERTPVATVASVSEAPEPISSVRTSLVATVWSLTCSRLKSIARSRSATAKDGATSVGASSASRSGQTFSHADHRSRTVGAITVSSSAGPSAAATSWAKGAPSAPRMSVIRMDAIVS